jgi:hypothetical protein
VEGDVEQERLGYVRRETPDPAVWERDLQTVLQRHNVGADAAEMFRTQRTDPAMLDRVRRQEHGWVRDVLAPEGETGVVADAEVEALAGREPRRRYLHSLPHGHDRRAGGHVMVAVEDLIEELAAARGQDTDRVAFARSEVARLRAAT